MCIVDGQPESIVQDIENMVRSYIEKVIVLILLKNMQKDIWHIRWTNMMSLKPAICSQTVSFWQYLLPIKILLPQMQLKFLVK